MKKRQLTLAEGLSIALMLAGALLASWISNVQAVSTIQTKQEDDREQVKEFRQEMRERLTRIENKIDKKEDKK